MTNFAVTLTLGDLSIIFAATTLVASSVAAYVRLSLSPLQSKVNDLWNLYIVDAVRERRQLGFTIEHSPEMLSQLWRQYVPIELRTSIDNEIVTARRQAPNDLTLRIWHKHKAALEALCANGQITQKVLIGTIIYLINERKKNLPLPRLYN